VTILNSFDVLYYLT